MIRPLNLQIGIIVFVAMAGILAVRQAHGQAMSATARAAGEPTGTGTTNAPDKREARSTSTGSSKWTAGTTSFASPDKGSWGGSHGLSSTPKAAWTPGSAPFSQGDVQPGGVWRTPPSLSVPEGAASTNRTGAESISAEPGPSELQSSAMGASHVSASRISKPATSRVSISGIGSHQSDRQLGINARQSSLSAHQFGMPLQGKAGGKPVFGISGQRQSFTATHSGGIRSMRGSQSGSLSTERHGTTGVGGRPGALSPGLGQHPLGSRLGGTGSGFDANPWDPLLDSGQSKPR
jgi:hypothetical protein